MSSVSENTPAAILEGLSEETKRELLQRLAEELGFEVTEHGDPVDPQSDILDVVEAAIRGLQHALLVLQDQFAEGAEPDHTELNRAAESIELVVTELWDAHELLNEIIDAECDGDGCEDDA